MYGDKKNSIINEQDKECNNVVCLLYIRVYIIYIDK